MLFGSWAWVTLVEILNFHHSFELIFFFSFISVSFSKRKRQKRTKERERVATFSPEKRCQKRVWVFTVEHLDVCQRLSSASRKNHLPFGTLFVTEAHTRSPGCLWMRLSPLRGVLGCCQNKKYDFRVSFKHKSRLKLKKLICGRAVNSKKQMIKSQNLHCGCDWSVTGLYLATVWEPWKVETATPENYPLWDVRYIRNVPGCHLEATV